MGVENLLEGLNAITGNETEQLSALKALDEKIIQKIAEDEANLNQVKSQNFNEFSPRVFVIYNFHGYDKFKISQPQSHEILFIFGPKLSKICDFVNYHSSCQLNAKMLEKPTMAEMIAITQK